MDHLEAMKVFVEVAKQQSFVGASEQLKLSAPAVTRAVAGLEDRLGVKLLHRSTRHVRLTEAGSQYLGDSKRILEDIEESEAAAAGIYANPKGTLNITAPILFGEMHIVPIISEYLADNPEVSVRAFFTDRISSMIEDELDIAVRIDKLKDSSLYATQVGSVRRIICAAPKYLQQYGEPRHPEELKQHHIIFPTMHSPSTNWSFNIDGKKQTLKLQPRLHCFHGGAAIKAALEGVGITRVMSYQVGRELEQGTLVRVLSDYEDELLPVSLLRLEGRRMNAKIRAFLDLATERLRANPFIRAN
ncbi:LysR family transcriptional regulator [Agaribacterium haliotis]|uniref:LysR family transcriptional regulator n=1 Tax=Agaribacterium haliotis TaxID=2013869 RepID=UPI000BB56BF3|nr:LysR family transcriptional regulator [Agaribacterium haliotis]